jgi:hypothetical protein
VVSTHWIGFPKSVTWSGLDEALSGTREDYRGAQPPLKIVEQDTW